MLHHRNGTDCDTGGRDTALLATESHSLLSASLRSRQCTHTLQSQSRHHHHHQLRPSGCTLCHCRLTTCNWCHSGRIHSQQQVCQKAPQAKQDFTEIVKSDFGYFYTKTCLYFNFIFTFIFIIYGIISNMAKGSDMIKKLWLLHCSCIKKSATRRTNREGNLWGKTVTLSLPWFISLFFQKSAYKGWAMRHSKC